MLESKVLVRELLGAKYGSRASTIAVNEIPALDHEAFDLA